MWQEVYMDGELAFVIVLTSVLLLVAGALLSLVGG